MAADLHEGGVRVLVVDDSAVARGMIVSQLSRDSGIKVVGEAENGVEALKKTLDLKPDLITIDIQMPMMDGLCAIEQIMARNPLPILVLTSLEDADTAFAALSKGALEVMEKPRVGRPFIFLSGKVKALAGVRVPASLGRMQTIPGRRYRGGRETPSPAGPSRGVVAIASSMGGPRALSLILSTLPADLSAPVLVAQHMSEGFTDSMVQWLDRSSRIAVHSAVNGETVCPGRVYVSPSEQNMSVSRTGRIVLSDRRGMDIYRPCCDVLLESVAEVYGSSAIGVILTGMGNDGAEGMSRIREAGGVTIAQDESTSAVFGMPKAAIGKGCISIVLPLDKISAEIVKRLWIGLPAMPSTCGSTSK